MRQLLRGPEHPLGADSDARHRLSPRVRTALVISPGSPASGAARRMRLPEYTGQSWRLVRNSITAGSEPLREPRQRPPGEGRPLCRRDRRHAGARRRCRRQAENKPGRRKRAPGRRSASSAASPVTSRTSSKRSNIILTDESSLALKGVWSSYPVACHWTPPRCHSSASTGSSRPRAISGR